MDALTLLSKRLESVLEDMQLGLPLKVINEIVDIIKARRTSSLSYLSHTQTRTSYRTCRVLTKPPIPLYTILASVPRQS
jgi:hypothetical protein